MIRLRPHHLLCALTFVGEGYSDAFVANFRAVLARVDAGEPIEIVEGPDDICAPLVAAGDAHCGLERLHASDADALADVRASDALREILAARALDVGRVARLREAFSAGSIRAACANCSWHDLCTQVARENYARAVLHGADA